MTDYLDVSPARGMTVTKKCDVRTTNFGDNYAQRNSLPPVMQVQVAFKGLDRGEASDLKSKFDHWQGVDSFYWRVDSSRPYKLYYVEEWQEEFIGNSYSIITATFLEEFQRVTEDYDFHVTPQTLQLIPNVGAVMETSYRSRNVQFMGGYREGSADGQNPSTKSWSVQCRGMEASKSYQLDDFLTKVRGIAPFYWSEFGFSPATEMYICPEWTFEFLNNDAQNFSASFVQIFDHFGV